MRAIQLKKYQVFLGLLRSASTKHKNTKLFISLLLFSAFSHADCPKELLQGAEKTIYVCDSQGDIVQHKRFVDEQLVEQNFFESGSKRPYRRDVFISKYAKPASYRFKYMSQRDDDYRISKIDIYDLKGDFVGSHEVKVDSSFIQKHESSKPAKVLIIDTGFNWTHPDLVNKHYYNSEEIINDLDDDGDGLADNITTLNGVLGRGGSVDYTSNINQIIQLPTKDAPLSHGGFVASVAMKNIDHQSFIGLGGDIFSPVYLYKALELINKHDIRFVNMSFGFGDKANPIAVGRESFEAISGIVNSSYNTVYVVAAGNASRDFDETKYSEYPACFKSRNLITVGALNTDKIDAEDLEDYEIAHFSNRGERCVDLYAPGVGVEGVGLGESHMKASGTSVSSPFVLNVMMKMYEINSALKASDYKKILLETVYVPQSPLPSRSGGIVYPERAYQAVRNTLAGLSVDESIEISKLFLL